MAPWASARWEPVLDVCLAVVGLVHIALCPYTKVEESFNLQATHDILYHGPDLHLYDHNTFPGVVPRTFLAPLVLSAVSYPFVSIVNIFGISKFASQYIVRAALCCLVLSAFKVFRTCVRNRFGPEVSQWLAAITLSQFHFLFYSSRPLPNILALVPVLLSLSWWLQGRAVLFLLSAAFSILVLRGELALLLGFVLLMELIVGRISITRLVSVGLLSLLLWPALTVMVDSVFWGRLLWPEAEVMHYNLYLNKSGEWGRMPLLWYFYSALPRALLSSFLLLPVCPALDRRSLLLLLPAGAYVCVYSLLPHKELRFIIYTVPILNTAAAMAAAKIWQSRLGSLLGRFLSLCLLGHLLLNCLLSVALLHVSSLNYPGGQAIKSLHDLQAGVPSLSVHLDVFSCQTGISRFAEENPDWSYNKTEGLSLEDLGQFSHLLMEGHRRHSLDMKPFLETHTFLAEIEAYSGLEVHRDTFPPVTVSTKTAIFVLQRNNPTGD